MSGHRPRSHTVVAVKVDQQGRLLPPVMAAHSMVMQKDPRRFSEASIVPPPRPPPPNLKRLNMKTQRRPAGHPVAGMLWPPQMVSSPAVLTQHQPQPQPQAQPPHPPQMNAGGSNLMKMGQMARSTPQLDDYTDNRERERNRDREKQPHVQNTRDHLISQVTDPMLSSFME